MLTREITYEDYNGVTKTETFYFNLTKPELVELEVDYDKGFQEHLQAIVESEDHKALIKQFKEIILMSYGEKTADGKRFIKNEELTEAFVQSPAYSVLFMDLAQDYNLAAAFLIGIVPKDMTNAMEKEMAEQTATLPPPPPPA